MATENIIMAIVKKGGDRQEAHEKIRVGARVPLFVPHGPGAGMGDGLGNKSFADAIAARL